MSHVEEHTDHDHQPSYGIYVVTWIALLALTALTVTVAGINLSKLSVTVAVVIATIKASVVLAFFMHLKQESQLLKTMVYVTLGTFIIFVVLTFSDTLFR